MRCDLSFVPCAPPQGMNDARDIILVALEAGPACLGDLHALLSLQYKVEMKNIIRTLPYSNGIPAGPPQSQRSSLFPRLYVEPPLAFSFQIHSIPEKPSLLLNPIFRSLHSSTSASTSGQHYHNSWIQ